MDERHSGAGVCVDHVDDALHLLSKGLDDPRAQSWLGFFRPGWHANAVIPDRQSPVRAVRAIIYHDLAVPTVGEGVLEGIDYEFGSDETQAHGHVRIDHTVVDGHRDRQLL